VKVDHRSAPAASHMLARAVNALIRRKPRRSADMPHRLGQLSNAKRPAA